MAFAGVLQLSAPDPELQKASEKGSMLPLKAFNWSVTHQLPPGLSPLAREALEVVRIHVERCGISGDPKAAGT